MASRTTAFSGICRSKYFLHSGARITSYRLAGPKVGPSARPISCLIRDSFQRCRLNVQLPMSPLKEKKKKIGKKKIKEKRKKKKRKKKKKKRERKEKKKRGEEKAIKNALRGAFSSVWGGRVWAQRRVEPTRVGVHPNPRVYGRSGCFSFSAQLPPGRAPARRVRSSSSRTAYRRIVTTIFQVLLQPSMIIRTALTAGRCSETIPTNCLSLLARPL